LSSSLRDDIIDDSLPDEAPCGRVVYFTNFFLSSGLDKKKFSTNKISSLYFMSPERIIGDLDLKSDKGISKCDIWSVGVVIFFLVFGYLPYQASSLNKLIKCIQKNKLNFEM